MTIYDPDPAERVSALREGLTILADTLRQQGAETGVTDHSSAGIHTIIMTARMPCSVTTAEEIARKLEDIANRSEGEAYCTLRSPIPAGLPDGEHGFALHYHVMMKPPRPRKRARVAA